MVKICIDHGYEIMTNQSDMGDLDPIFKATEGFIFIFFNLFCVVFKYFDFLNLFLPRNVQYFAENSCYFVC